VPVTLVCPGATVPGKTARMYSRITPAHYTDGAATSRMAEILERGASVVPDVLYNVFEKVAPEVFPDWSRLFQVAGAATGNPLHLSGAGPAMFCLPSSHEEYQRLANALQPHGVGVYFVRTLTPATAPGAK
jgi:4-diphosphocytidyl-2-C-methyl-D-erythritol kinase